MANGIKTEIHLDGMKELATFLDQLPKRSAKKALRSAVTAGAAPIAKAAKAEAPDQSGTLKRAQSKKVKVYPNGNAVAIIGANKATTGTFNGRKRVPAFYMHLVLQGTKPHSLARGASARRKAVRTAVLHAITGARMHPGAKANDFLTRAVHETQAESKRLMEEKMRDVVTSEAAKLAGGAK